MHQKTKKWKNQLIDRDNKVVIAKAGGPGWTKMGEGSKKIQSSSYKINKSWWYNVQVQHGDYS